MKFNDVADMIFTSWKAGDHTPHILLGPPGIGKSAIAGLVAQRMTEHVRSRNPNAGEAVCRILDCTTKLPEDIPGLPHIDRDGRESVTRYAPQSWLHELCTNGAYGVLCFDDGTQASQSVQLAMRQLLLQREVHDAKLAERVTIIVTGNRREDKSGATTLPAHFINACSLHAIEPEFDSWANWYGQQPNHAPEIASFLRFRPAHFHKTPADADQMGRFPTPRTWTKLGARWAVHEGMKSRWLDVASGLVGEGPATEFVAFLNTRAQLVDPESVLRDPQRALPNPRDVLNTPDKAYAMITGLAEVAAQWAKSGDKAKEKGHPLAWLRAIGHSTDGNREFIAVSLNTFIANGGAMKGLLQAATANEKDPLVRVVVDYLAKVVK